eukprot:TRINITY_DN2554_c0_g1_i1.p1 TRINITY_DN2554_c0_g1~~TRINITY_DN2554_c0_g1_i1.p1  ORF type:complete len:509 (-),score=173.49 TRINITY_DN2554_c0_g1_i1:37-1563(-)
MVLGELGERLQNAVKKITTSQVVDEKVVGEMIKEIQRALLESDVNVKLVADITKEIKSKTNAEALSAANKRNKIKTVVFEALSKLLDPGKKPFQPVKGRCNVIMFVGLQGSGKTTSCSKLAYYYQRKKFKTALVCADTYRAGAFDQLKQNATKAGIQYYGSYSERDPVKVAAEGVEIFREEKVEIIIVDTSGRHKQEAALFEEMEQVAAVVKPDEIIFTMDGSIGQAAYDQALAFHQSVDVGSVILTKLDGHAKGGGALSAVAATQSPIIFIGTGEHITDFERFDPKSFVSRLLGMGDIAGLVDAMSNLDMKEQKQNVDDILKGKFCMRIMRDQFQNLLQMGPIGQVMGMIPGLSQMMPKGSEQQSEERIKRSMTIMDSMTDQELDATDLKIFNESRIRRIARGSGVHPLHVQELFAMFKPFKDALDKISALSKKPKGPRGQPSMRDLSSMMNPEMLKQMGGPAGLQSMMKQFEKMGMGPGGRNFDPSKMDLSKMDMSKMFGALGGMQ